MRSTPSFKEYYVPTTGNELRYQDNAPNPKVVNQRFGQIDRDWGGIAFARSIEFSSGDGSVADELAFVHNRADKCIEFLRVQGLPMTFNHSSILGKLARDAYAGSSFNEVTIVMMLVKKMLLRVQRSRQDAGVLDAIGEI
jgi:hypothetical protein